MKQSDITWKQASPCIGQKMAIHEGIVCPVCKAETEVWSDEEDATCHSCGYGIATKYSNKGC